MNNDARSKPLAIAQANHATLVKELSELILRANTTIMQARQRENNSSPPDTTCYDCPVYKARHRRSTDKSPMAIARFI